MTRASGKGTAEFRAGDHCPYCLAPQVDLTCDQCGRWFCAECIRRHEDGRYLCPNCDERYAEEAP